MKTQIQHFLKQRKVLLIIPFVILSLITLIFWAGKRNPLTISNTSAHSGLNANLPEAKFSKDETWNKFSLYEKAERDSIKYEQARERDPYFDLVVFKSEKQEPLAKEVSPAPDKLIDSFPHKDKRITDPNEERVNKKLEELYTEINKGAGPLPNQNPQRVTNTASDMQFTSDVDRLEQMMEMMTTEEPDPEMKQIENVLDKILDIQHPQRLKEKYDKQLLQDKTQALPITIKDTDPISDWPDLLVSKVDSLQMQYLSKFSMEQNGFFGLQDEILFTPQHSNALEAVVHDTQELVSGATIRIRILSDITIQGNQIPKDQFVYGKCTIAGERLMIEINSIRINNTILPVALKAYDLDGLEGIYIPGALERDAAKQASGNALQNIQLMSLDTSIGAQAATAGVEAAKGLLGKKAKAVKVTIKAGYRILLLDTNLKTPQL